MHARGVFVVACSILMVSMLSDAGLAQEPSVPAVDRPLLAAAATEVATVAAQTAAPAAVAFDYSDAYRIRAKIHRVSSVATLPLFVTEAVVGQSLYDNPTSSKKSAHLAVATGIGALFAVNTVTGVWNLAEARRDPSHRRRRLAHGLLMLGADVGFLTTAALGPESEHGEVEGSKSAHRAAAFSSIGAATAGYLIMLLGGH